MRLLIISLAVALGAWLALVAGLAIAGRRSAAREIVSFLPNLVLLFRGLLRDSRVSRGSKLLLGLGVLWFSSPIDLIPEFIPVAGPLDDAIVAALILRHVLKQAGPGALQDHWRGNEGSLRVLRRVAGLPSAPGIGPE